MLPHIRSDVDKTAPGIIGGIKDVVQQGQHLNLIGTIKINLPIKKPRKITRIGQTKKIDAECRRCNFVRMGEKSYYPVSNTEWHPMAVTDPPQYMMQYSRM